LAASLDAQGKYAEAGEGYRTAPALYKKLLGEEHPLTATSYNHLANNLSAQGKYAEAEVGYRRALALRRKLLGEEHPDTATSYNNLAFNLNAQGKYAKAEDLWARAAASFTTARHHFAHAGLDRAARTGEGSPVASLAGI